MATPQTIALFDAQAAIHVEELNKQFSDWPNLTFNADKWESAGFYQKDPVRRCAEVMEKELSTLRSQIEGWKFSFADMDARRQAACAMCDSLRSQIDALKVNYQASDNEAAKYARLCDQLTAERDALKAEVVRKDEALRFIGNYQFDSEPVGGIMEMQEVAQCALTPTAKGSRS